MDISEDLTLEDPPPPQILTEATGPSNRIPRGLSINRARQGPTLKRLPPIRAVLIINFP